MPTLKLVREGNVESEITLQDKDLRLGRGRDNDVVLQDPDRTLSRHHAELRCEGDGWVYLDLNSANGSWVGERRITRQELAPGTIIVLGDYQLIVAAAAAAEPHDIDATQIVRPAAKTVRMPAAVVASADGRPPRDTAMVGGAVQRAAAKPGAAAAPKSSPVFRRIIIYGSILVFGAFAIMLAALLRPDPAAAVEEAPPAASSTPVPAPAAAAPPAEALAPSVPAEPAPTPEARPEPPPAPPAPAPAPAPVARRVAAPPRADTDRDAAAIPARPDETRVALQQRRDDIRRRYAQGLKQLAAEQFVEARETLAGIAKDAPKFRDVPARVGEAEAGVRRQADERFKAAAQLEQAQNWTEAMKAYERLKPFAAMLPTLSEATERTRTRMHEAGADALTRARQFDSRGRVPEAIAWYQRAINWLPPDHPGLPAARQRLAQLMNQP